MFSFGNTLSTSQANHNDAVGCTSEVGSYPANAFGLHDMHGNVGEWCKDCYDPKFYEKSPAVDPLCKKGKSRVIRGGSWVRGSRYCRSAFRTGSIPEYRGDDVGFRIRCASFD